jgi:hypothetical protein
MKENRNIYSTKTSTAWEGDEGKMVQYITLVRSTFEGWTRKSEKEIKIDLDTLWDLLINR